MADALSLKDEFLTLLEKDREFRYAVAGLLGLEEILRRLDRNEQELIKLREDLNKLREDMNRGFMLIERHISALGARWGLMAEEAFRQSIRGLVEREFGFRVERWTKLDREGVVFGYPSQVEIDVAISNEKIMLVEVKSHVRQSDVYTFKRKAELYEKLEGRKPSKLLLVTPYAEEKALEAAKHLGIEIYTKF
ncbi:hypothetical protein DRO24_04610 [Candidatus Bathyarchaeota archaeon]|nr:MAG: hypothetical protein DRO24_04610 [Candidatus Bathyarchaeota archaeon]